MFPRKRGFLSDCFDMIRDYFPDVFVKLFFGTFVRVYGMFHVVTIILFLFFVTYFVQSGKEMVVIIVLPRTNRITDIVEVFSSTKRSTGFKISISHGKSLM